MYTAEVMAPPPPPMHVCVCVCVRVHACVCACVCVHMCVCVCVCAHYIFKKCVPHAVRACIAVFASVSCSCNCFDFMDHCHHACMHAWQFKAMSPPHLSLHCVCVCDPIAVQEMYSNNHTHTHACMNSVLF